MLQIPYMMPKGFLSSFLNEYLPTEDGNLISTQLVSGIKPVAILSVSFYHRHAEFTVKGFI